MRWVRTTRQAYASPDLYHRIEDAGCGLRLYTDEEKEWSDLRKLVVVSPDPTRITIK